jgi:hypothetical protein
LAQEVANVDFSLAPIPTAKISGHTFMSNGEMFQGGVQMRPSRRSGAVRPSRSAREPVRTAASNSERPAGRIRHLRLQSVEIGWQFVTVSGSDVTDVAVQTLAGSTIAGHITFDGADPPKPGDIKPRRSRPIPISRRSSAARKRGHQWRLDVRDHERQWTSIPAHRPRRRDGM